MQKVGRGCCTGQIRSGATGWFICKEMECYSWTCGIFNLDQKIVGDLQLVINQYRLRNPLKNISEIDYVVYK